MGKVILGNDPYAYILSKINPDGLVVGPRTRKDRPSRFNYYVRYNEVDEVVDHLRKLKVDHWVSKVIVGLFKDKGFIEDVSEAEELYRIKFNATPPDLSSHHRISLKMEDVESWMPSLLEHLDLLDESGVYLIKTVGQLIETNNLLVSAPLNPFSSSIGRPLNLSKLKIFRTESPVEFEEKYNIVYDLSLTSDVYRYFRKGRKWFVEYFRLPVGASVNAFVIKSFLKLESYYGASLYGPLAQWDLTISLGDVLRRFS